MYDNSLAGFYLLGGGEGGKMLKVIADGGCRHRLQFSRGGLGACPPRSFLNFEPSESGSEAF